MINIISSNYSNFIVMMLIVIGGFVYSNKRFKKYEKIANRKLRYGIFISSIIMALPCTLVLNPPFLFGLLEKLFGISSKNSYLILSIIAAVIFLVMIKFIYVPLNKDENDEI
ncbi:hypothetical protein [Clostridium beijerinckii]|uniref:hypothetical protein n=2 Tax=Clostridium beijerinckii TaxID=1520 RepID=UPI0014948DCF|nr:hypothetical protein [Clostridium beijerinckii]NYC00739.1 prepilin signal peptidase PulO-like enzyme (type II secretory pathway) [Clostridium beijerinckii]